MPLPRFILVILLICVIVQNGFAQTSPPEGLRKNTPNVHAFINARIVQAPGKVISNGTLVIRDGVITAVGARQPSVGLG